MKMSPRADGWPSEPVAPTEDGRRRARRHVEDRPTEARAQPVSGSRSRHFRGNTLSQRRAFKSTKERAGR